MRYSRREKIGGQQSRVSLSAPKAAEPSTMPFAQRLTCTIDDACEVTGLGRTKLYELIGAGRIVTTTIGRRRLVVVRSLLALLDTHRLMDARLTGTTPAWSIPPSQLARSHKDQRSQLRRITRYGPGRHLSCGVSFRDSILNVTSKNSS